MCSLWGIFCGIVLILPSIHLQCWNTLWVIISTILLKTKDLRHKHHICNETYNELVGSISRGKVQIFPFTTSHLKHINLVHLLI